MPDRAPALKHEEPAAGAPTITTIEARAWGRTAGRAQALAPDGQPVPKGRCDPRRGGRLVAGRARPTARARRPARTNARACPVGPASASSSRRRGTGRRRHSTAPPVRRRPAAPARLFRLRARLASSRHRRARHRPGGRGSRVSAASTRRAARSPPPDRPPSAAAPGPARGPSGPRLATAAGWRSEERHPRAGPLVATRARQSHGDGDPLHTRPGQQHLEPGAGPPLHQRAAARGSGASPRPTRHRPADGPAHPLRGRGTPPSNDHSHGRQTGDGDEQRIPRGS